MSSSSAPKEVVPEGYKPLEASAVIDYIRGVPALSSLLGLADGKGPHDDADDVYCEEIGDGNLNLVFIVRRRSEAARAKTTPVIIKQALPWVRCIGESWPLPLSRAYYEHLALVEHNTHAPGLVPKVYNFDETMGAIAMELLDAPHIILRKGIIAGTRYPELAESLGTFLARTLFRTSHFRLGHAEHMASCVRFSGNTALAMLTHQVVFTDPFAGGEANRHTSPQLDEVALDIRGDSRLKRAVAMLKWKFATCQQSVLHGDLHTGSVMVDGAGSVRVIDPEFVFAGPMGFDVGAFVGNMFLGYYAHAGAGHGDAPGEAGYPRWILDCVEGTWDAFRKGFAEEWAQGNTGDIPGKGVFSATESDDARDAFLDSVLRDALGYAGTLMIRRIVGVAHVEDLDSIADQDTRAKCELAAIAAARRLILESEAGSIQCMKAATGICVEVAKTRGLKFH